MDLWFNLQTGEVQRTALAGSPWQLSATDSNTSCSSFKSCTSCTSYPNVELDCSWCTTDSTCIEKSDRGNCVAELLGSCDETYYTVIFLIILGSMFCLCCATCYLRRLQHFHHEQLLQAMLSPILPQRAREYLFRNSLLNDGELEWMCIICGFDNKPRSKHCSMCGTSHDFSLDYKVKKLEEKRERSRKREERKRQQDAKNTSKKNKADEELTSPLLRDEDDDEDHSEMDANQKFGGKSSGTGSKFIVGSSMSFANSIKSPLQSTHKSAQQSQSMRKNMDIPIADEAQISSISLSLKFFQPGGGGEAEAVPSTATGMEPLSPEKRKEAINFRRINQLTIRQKSARRRKMWQRQYDEKVGGMVWRRVPVKETKVGSAPFGYTPRNSFAASTSRWENSSSFSSVDQISFSGTRSKTALDALMDAAHNPPSTPQRSAPFNPMTSPMKVVSGVDFRPANNNNNNKKKNRSDSFDDAAFVSTSPGFTSVFDEQGDLQWEQVEPGKPIRRSSYGPTIARYPWDKINVSEKKAQKSTGGSSSPTPLLAAPPVEGAEIDLEARLGEVKPVDSKFDLASVAAYTFKDKQIWFLDRMAEMQKPWTDGFIKIEIRRSKLLDDSHRAWSQLRPEDFHKWMRFQFSGELGIDAGGLEREWFGLTTEEIFSPNAGLFTRCGTEYTGSYHINPISGAINANHLSYFRFVGRFLGKAIMEQQSLKANLSLPLRKQLISMPVTFSDLEFVDEELYRNLVWLNNADNVSDMMLDFTISYTAANQTVTYELKPDGQNIMVTNENKQEYLQLRLRHRLLDSIKLQLENLMMGFYEVIPPELLSVFDYQELDLLMCGVVDIDLDDWMRHTEYLGEYHKLGTKHRVIKWFWEVVGEMSEEERIRLLQFTTGCSRLPVQGFKALQSSDGRYRKFNLQSIHKADSIYPRAHTCFNKLDLPVYDSKAELEAYISVVISMEVVGFTME